MGFNASLFMDKTIRKIIFLTYFIEVPYVVVILLCKKLNEIKYRQCMLYSGHIFRMLY